MTTLILIGCLLVMVLTPPGNKYYKEKEMIIFTVTAYCPCEKCCGRWAAEGVDDSGNRITASGHKIKPGDRFVAAPRSIPFGTRLTIPDYNGGMPVTVEDRGGSIKGNRLDVFFDTHQEALEWGIKRDLMVQKYEY